MSLLSGILQQLPDGWRLVQMDELKAASRYSFVGGPFGSNLTRSDYIEEPGVPVIRGANMGGEQCQFIDDGFVYVSNEKADSLLQNLAFPGDLVFTQRGTLGQVVEIPRNAHFSRYVVSQSQMKLTVDESQASPRYLYRYFRSPMATTCLNQRIQATGVPHINLEILKTFPVLLPSLNSQRHIAAILDKADAIRRKRQDGIRLTEDLFRSTFLEMFGDPVLNSRNWPTAPLGSVAKLDRGRSRHRPRDEQRLYGGPYPFIQTGEVSRSDGYISEYSQTYSELGLAQSKLWPAGTLCITIAANIARTAILSVEACFPDSLVGLVAGEKLTIEYVRFWFVAMQKVIDAAATQVAQKNINLEVLNKLSIPVPPISLQKCFSLRVRQIYAVKRQRSEGVSKSGELFSSLAQRAFQGEL